MTVPYGWAAGVTDECCIASPTDQARMLCGRKRGFVPEVPPAFPAAVHDECQRLWKEGGHQAELVLGEYGECPVCSADLPLEDGKVAAHRKRVVGRGGPRVTSEPCPGAGMTPEGGR